MREHPFRGITRSQMRARIDDAMLCDLDRRIANACFVECCASDMEAGIAAGAEAGCVVCPWRYSIPARNRQGASSMTKARKRREKIFMGFLLLHIIVQQSARLWLFYAAVEKNAGIC